MSNAHLFVAVREASAGTFDVLGELGPGAKGGVVYLAREIAGEALVVLKLEPGDDGAGGTQYFLDVARELDASVPDVEMRCPRCRAKLRQWARFCTQCGLDVSGEAPASGEHSSRLALREQVRVATAGHYEFLGDILRSEGGGLVYFARDLTDGKIVALRLQKDMNKQFEVGVTRTLKAVGGEGGHAPVVGAAARPAVTIIQRSPLTHVGPIPTPGPRVPAPVPAGEPRQGAARGVSTGSPAPAAQGAAPNAGQATPRGQWWKVGRAKIAAAIAIGLIILLILTQL
jgi:hypothetical protein